MRPRWFTVLALGLASGLALSASQPDCSFLKNPDAFLAKTDNAQRMSDLTARVTTLIYADPPAAAATLQASGIPHKNFIDDYIFGRMATAGIKSAPLTSDAEFLRRVTLDLTGRIPSASDVDAFVSDPDPSKRDTKVDALIGTPEFVDKWTMFFGDLFRVNIATSAINRAVPGRDAYYGYVKNAIATNKPYDQIARDVITGAGDTFVQGEANWPLGNTVAMGPAQDTYDGEAVNLASMFLGINTVDCLLCHNGARHLDTVNLWGSKQLRQNMWGLSAYFARVRMTRQADTVNPALFKYIITDATTGEYNLNTTTGNRVARQPINGVSVVQPSNPFSSVTGTGIATGENRRQAIARQMTGDLQFSRAIVNYVWEKFMVQAFVTPSNAFDLARLDPNNPPPDPWTLQPTNPQLLDALAQWFQQNKYDLHALMSLIVKSSTYQLSSTYPGTWDASYVPYYARKFPRRLDAEEIHDAIVTATGVVPTYTITGSALPAVNWAMQFPDTSEPRSNGGVVQFLNSFGRGDRNTTFRRSDSSVLQGLNMMNNAFINTRIHQANAGSRVQTLLAQSVIPEVIVRQLVMNTLSRPATADEVAVFTGMFQLQGNKAAAENLQWVLLNKMDFLFNY
jgi:Protein of unknown function (DUF1549)/Protein of unknown function (DUF1553)